VQSGMCRLRENRLPDEILNRRLSVEECLGAVDECGAPIVSIAGGEPLLHKELPQVVEGIIQRRKYVYLCTNALLLKKRIDDYKPSPYLTFSIHLDGNASGMMPRSARRVSSTARWKPQRWQSTRAFGSH